MGRASCQCLVIGLSTEARRWHRLLLVAGPWEVVISSRQIFKLTRAFGISSSTCVSSRGSESNNS